MSLMAQMILWSHALAALVCGVLALDQIARPRDGWRKVAFVAALFCTAFWALAVAGIDADDVSTQFAGALRDLAWLSVMFLLVRRSGGGTRSLASVYVAVTSLIAASMALAALRSMPLTPSALAAVTDAWRMLRMMAAVGALVLVHEIGGTAVGATRAEVRLTMCALAAMWATDLLLLGASGPQAVPGGLVALRGVVMIGVGLMLAVAAERPRDGSLVLSRTVAVRTLSGIAAIGYVAATVALTMLADRLAGDHARIVQTAIVLGAAVALMTLLSSPWLRAWTRVKLAMHLFQHRYDYRVVWQRFTATLGRPGDGAGLEERIVKALADLTDSPAGLLLVQDGAGLGSAAAWNWDATGDVAEVFAQHLATGRIVEIDAVRAGTGSGADRELPGWIIDRSDTWAIVPLVHLGSLVGAIVLARPPVVRALDWEDFDLLRVAGRQAASYLAEQRSQTALADSQRFDEFNRRFAFILHDVKNLVSQLTLVARNAERHADNPAFRADMVATLKDSADRMNVLLARLSQHHAGPNEACQTVDVAALATRVAARSRNHSVRCTHDGAVIAIAQPGRLEQVLGHLIQNACEASEPAQPVVLCVAADGASAAITIQDHGCGMTPGFIRDELFRPFTSSKPGGFGIGAFEAKQLVHAMRGTIAVTSVAGEGTCFCILLPLAQALEEAA